MGHSAPKIAEIGGIVDELKALLGGDLLGVVDRHDEIGLIVARDALLGVMTKLRDEAQYQQLMEIAGVDYLERTERFEVVYMLLSVTRNHRIRVTVSTDEDHPVPSVTSIWPVAGWLEREVFDMYGVIFSGNTDLRRILTDYGFRGHPQRKDFPLTGYVELRYSEDEKRVVYEPVKLAQDFRNFDFMSPWEGAHYVLPGDEKARPEAPGAPQPPPPPPPPPAAPAVQASTPKVTEKPQDTGAGEPANSKAAEASDEGVKAKAVRKPATKAEKPRATKAKAAPATPGARSKAEGRDKAPKKPRTTTRKTEDKA